VASHPLASVNHLWADGVTVECFVRGPFGTATGSVVDSDVVTSGALEFTGLEDATNYIATQGGKSVQFRTAVPDTAGSGSGFVPVADDRPDSENPVPWVGATAPAAADDGDIWLDTSA
jgi:hypothetical protein